MKEVLDSLVKGLLPVKNMIGALRILRKGLRTSTDKSEKERIAEAIRSIKDIMERNKKIRE